MIRLRTNGSRLTYRQTSDLVLSSGSVAGTSPDDDARREGPDDERKAERGDAGSDGSNRHPADRRVDGSSVPDRDRRYSGFRALAEGRVRIDPSA